MAYLILFFFVFFLPSQAYAMPPVVAAVTAISGVIAAGGIAGAITSALVSGVISAALSFVSGALAGKPDSPSSSFGSIRTRGSTQQFRQPITAREMVYGEVRKSGPIIYAGVTDDNKHLHLVIALASHEIEEIGEIFINDLSVPVDDLNENGFVLSGRYKNLIRIKKHLGTDDQLADTDLINDVPEWTSEHRLRGVAYLYVRLRWNRDVFTSGIPNFSAWVKGKKCYDPRTATSYWTPNSALQSNEFLTNTYYGLKADNVDEPELIGATNTCEEIVTTQAIDTPYNNIDTVNNLITMEGDRLQYQTGDRVRVQSGTIGGIITFEYYYVIAYQRKDNPRIALASSLADAISGTRISLTSGAIGVLRKDGEPRYFGGGVLKISAKRGENFTDVLSGMSGNAVFAGGKWRILAGEYQTPTISFSEGDLASGINVETKVSRKDIFNQVQGVYVSPLNDGNPADYPLVKNDTYASQDGSEIKKNLDFPFTQRPHTAQRIAKLQLERMRQEITFVCRFKLTAFKVQVGDNFFFNFERYGWSNKVFEVLNWTLLNDNGAPVIEMTCRENDSSVYDWNNGEETSVDPAPNTSLPNPFDVAVVGGFSLDSILVSTQSGDKIFKVVGSWDLHDDEYVLSGGSYEIEFKESVQDDSDYKSAAKVDGSINQQEITGLQPDTEYDIRIYAYNYIGARSGPSLIEGFVVGSTVLTDTRDWENETYTSEDWENETLTSEDWEA